MIYELTRNCITKLDQTTFDAQSISDRGDLQRLFKRHIDVIAPDTLIIAEEFCEWDESKRRIDLLALDREANLVVIELKRTEDGGHMELQAIRYAAMISAMTWTKAVEVYGRYLEANGSGDDPERAILAFLNWTEAQEDNFAQDVRIVLVSAEFSKEITTSVMWLNERGLDIRCVRLRPYTFDSRILLDVQQIIPLPEAGVFMIQLKRKAQEQRIARSQGSNSARYDFTANGSVLRRLTKRALGLEVVRAGLRSGLTAQQVGSVISPGRWISVEGNLSADEFRRTVSALETKQGARYDLTRYFCEDGELFHVDGRTYALTNQWGPDDLAKIDELIALLPLGTLHYEKSAE